jgi:hypothetical protein
LLKKANDILTALIQGMRSNIAEIKFASVNSFSLSLDYFRGNFQSQVKKRTFLTLFLE